MALSSGHKIARSQRSLRREPTCDAATLDAAVLRWGACQVSAEAIMNGDFLPQMAAAHVQAFAELAPGREVAPVRTLTWASACSGSGGDKLVQRAMATAYNNSGIAMNFKTVFDCEVDIGKREYLQKLQQSVDSSVQPCLFKDVCDLAHARAECVVHDRKCVVSGVDVFVCCTSCKDVSRVNTHNKSTGLVLKQKESSGGSAQTFQGMLAYLEAHRPTLFFFENVDAISDTEPVNGQSQISNQDLVLSEFASRGYEAQPMMLESHFFGLPQSRRRFYVAGVLTRANPAIDFSQRSIEVIFSTFRSFLKVCQRKPPCASKLLLPDSDPCVESELQRRLSKPASRCTYDVNKYQAMFAAWGLRWGETQPPKELGDSPWWDTLTAGQKDSCLFSLATDDKSHLMRDVLWSCGKVRVSREGPTGHISFTVIPKQVVLLFPPGATPRLQLGREAMLLQGFPLPQPESPMSCVPERMWQELAGNMVSLPCCMSILMAMLAAVDWRKKPVVEVASSEELEAADEAAKFIESMLAVSDDDGEVLKKPRIR